MKTIDVHPLQPISYLQYMIAKGGPEKREYDTLNAALDSLCKDFKEGNITEEVVETLNNGFGAECMAKTIHGHIRRKPYGYAGDFMIIDRIYQEQFTDDQRFLKWDIFWNNLAAMRAVRNRKDYFIKTMTKRIAEQGNLKLLDIASGPARDVAELYETIDPAQLKTLCLDADATAIDYAQNLNKPNADQIRFIHKNIFRFTTDEQFDIVWSAGLFDYFDDILFVKLLRKFMSWTKSGGEVIIGNFSTQNPSRDYMELVGDWFLQHRSEAQLIKMAVAAGAEEKNISIGKEMEGVNLFLHVKV